MILLHVLLAVSLLLGGAYIAVGAGFSAFLAMGIGFFYCIGVAAWWMAQDDGAHPEERSR